MKYQSLFSGITKKNMNLSSAEFAYRVLTVKLLLEKRDVCVLLEGSCRVKKNPNDSLALDPD